MREPAMPTTETASKLARVAAGDDRLGYDGPEKAFHWLTVVLVLTLYALSQIWGFVPRDAGRHAVIVLHISLGVVLTAVLALRILWRVGPGRRVLPATTGLVELAAQAMHYVLYAVLITQMALGFLYRWSETSVPVFGLFEIPSPASFTKPQHHLFGQLHNWMAYVILGLAGLHAAAALYHHLVLRDDVLLRMWPGHRARLAAQDAPDPRQIEQNAR
jgi:cytochrome b561